MQKVTYILITVLLLTCVAMSNILKRKGKPAAYVNKITVAGSTLNLKGHAAIIAGSKDIYFVDGMGEWEKEWINQQVKVTGDLEVIGENSFAKENKNKQINIIKSAVVLLQ